jgi:hypothetical protein
MPAKFHYFLFLDSSPEEALSMDRTPSYWQDPQGMRKVKVSTVSILILKVTVSKKQSTKSLEDLSMVKSKNKKIQEAKITTNDERQKHVIYCTGLCQATFPFESNNILMVSVVLSQ